MHYQSGFNIRPTQWATIASAVEGKSGKFSWGKDLNITLEVEPYLGNLQGAIEWRVLELPSPEIRQAVLRGIKTIAKENGKDYPRVIIPIINFKVIITGFIPHTADVATYAAEGCAADAFSDALKHAELLQLESATNTGYWESADEQTKSACEFQILPLATATIQVSGETRYVYKRQSGGPGQYAIIHLLLEPYQGQTEFLCESDVMPQECPT
jgi:hypothetical protein